MMMDDRHRPGGSPSADQRQARDERGPYDGRIAWIEVIAYTALIGLIALLATGWFDVLLPWT
ncbi:MAG: hypothetical protein J7480_08165 [Microbacteriaceae bacterium]|nr:hypothetical protein [Microbacteriaceae bacterium]